MSNDETAKLVFRATTEVWVDFAKSNTHQAKPQIEGLRTKVV